METFAGEHTSVSVWRVLSVNMQVFHQIIVRLVPAISLTADLKNKSLSLSPFAPCLPCLFVIFLLFNSPLLTPTSPPSCFSPWLSLLPPFAESNRAMGSKTCKHQDVGQSSVPSYWLETAVQLWAILSVCGEQLLQRCMDRSIVKVSKLPLLSITCPSFSSFSFPLNHVFKLYSLQFWCTPVNLQIL